MTIKLDSVKIDTADKDGVWIASSRFPDVRFKVRPIGYTGYVAAKPAEAMRLFRKYGSDDVPTEEQLVSEAVLLAKHILLGWEGFDVAYSQEKAVELLSDPAYRLLVEDVQSCSRQAQMPQLAFIEASVKN